MRHRVDAARAPKAPPVLPRDTWTGGTFREATGTDYDVIWSGAAKDVGLCAGWLTYAERRDAVIRLRPNR